jgi:RNA polymerase sigma-70 factor (ECF subfamily)
VSDTKLDETLLDATSSAWNLYLAALDGLRPDLFRYCRKLTGNVWDAEDLVQDALEQGFARLGGVTHGIENPRGYVLRIASNLWISRQRRERLARGAATSPRAETLRPASGPSPESGSDLREAGAALLAHLAPQERAAVVLKETFELSLEEIAEALGTSVGAVKSALHRGRGRLRDLDPEQPPRHPVSRAVVDRFVERFNARDLEGLLALMLETASIEMPGVDLEIGREVFGRKGGWFEHNFISPFDGKPTTGVWETALFAGEPIVLVQNQRDGQLCVTSVMRLETHEERVSRIRVYAMCPDAVREVATALGRPFASLGIYRFPYPLGRQMTHAARGAVSAARES